MYIIVYSNVRIAANNAHMNTNFTHFQVFFSQRTIMNNKVLYNIQKPTNNAQIQVNQYM